MERWLSGLYVAVVLGLGLVTLWPRLTVQFAPVEAHAPLPLTTSPSAPGLSAQTLPEPPKRTGPEPLSANQAKNSARTLTPGPVRAAAAKVNLNTASQAELESLPRVGPALARRILEGRPYRSLEDLDRVKGVGPKMLELLAPLVSF
ncbi:MAG: ComEA family DNA-binding protein [Thermaceae bacterium]|nr:ComEA family DNA-binding protein [Thermaceae bacterium]